jgi:SAM-dependent methyltransferase
MAQSKGAESKVSAIDHALSIWRASFGFSRRRQLWKWLIGEQEVQWLRVVMIEETRKWIEALNPATLDALEISGNNWRNAGFKSYRITSWPEYDICDGPLPQAFDLIVADQVFEHLLWPYRAAKNVHAMLRPGGHFLITTPFLIRVHNHPVDCSRWTEVGLKHFLAECGFPIEKIKTGSWGNRVCVRSNFMDWTPYRRFHSLRNEPNFPVSVWALAEAGPCS